MYNLLGDLSIIEASSYVASPTAGLYCAQFGAEVIRVDHVAGGLDYERYLMTREGRSLSWENLNRAKKSVALNLSSSEGRELLVELVRATGQMITNFPVESFLSHDKVAQGRADLVSVRVLGWRDGRQAMDFTVNAATGYPLMTGPEDWEAATAPPISQPLPAWDFITGAYCAFAMLAGLRHRERTGQGTEMRVPLGDVAMGTVANSGAMAEMLYRGGDRERIGNAVWGAFGRDFQTRDGQRIMIAALTAKQWTAAVEAFGVSDSVAAIEARENADFRTSDHLRFVHRHKLFEVFERAAATMDMPVLEARLAQAGATYERYRTMFEAASDPFLVTENPLFGPSPDNPSGFDYPAARSFAHIPATPPGDPQPAPLLGAQSEEILSARLGLSSGAIARLIDQGIVGTPS